MIVLYVALAWLFGVYVGSWFQPNIAIFGPMALAGAVGAAGFWPDRNMRLASLLVLSISLAMLRSALAVPPADPIIDYGDKCTVTGTVIEDPIPKTRSLQLKVHLSTLQHGSSLRQLDTVILAWVPSYEEFEYGDKVRLTGGLQAPSIDLGPGYRQFLAGQGVYYTMSYPEVEILGDADLYHPLRLLNSLRGEVRARLEKSMSAPESALLAGILLGDRSAMPQSLRDDFARTGTTHIIAISGQNITMVAGVIVLLAGLLRRRRISLVLVIASITLYAMFVGAGASVVRAAIMGILWAVARHFGREASAGISIAIAACLMTLYQPSIIWDVGFQLSFAATLGLIYLSPPLLGKLSRLPVVLREVLAITIASQVAVLPVQLYNFQQLPLVSVPANLLAAPALPIVMLTGGLTALASMIWQPLGVVAAWPAWLVLSYLIRVVEAFAGVPFAAVEMPAFPLALAGLWYLVLAVFLLGPKWQMVFRGSGAQAALWPVINHGFTLPFLTSTALLIWLMVALRVIFGW